MRFGSVLHLYALMMLLSLPSVGQKTPTDTPVFTAGTEFVQVPVVVRKGGRHVSGLTKADFTLQQDGKNQAITSFEEVHSTPPVRSKAGEDFRNTYAAGQTPQQITIIAIDTINTPTLDQAYFHKELVAYLSEKASTGEPVGLVELRRNGIRVVRDFTTEPKTVLAAIQNRKLTQPTNNKASSNILSEVGRQSQDVIIPGLAGNGTLEVAEEKVTVFQDTTARIDSLFALQQLAQALKGIAGRKTLILVSSGFQFMSGLLDRDSMSPGLTVIKPERVGETLDQHAYTWKLLNDANVAVYPIDARRTVNTAYEAIDPSAMYAPRRRDKSLPLNNDREIVGTFQSLAAETGGKPCIYRTDLSNCIREAAADNHDYYLLGFYVDKNNREPGWHKISLKLSQKASLRYRQGFVIANIKPDESRQTDLQLAINSPFAYTALPFTGRFAGFTAAQKENIKTTAFEVRIPPESLTIDDSAGKVNFDIVAVIRAEGGKEAARLGQRIQRTLSTGDIAEIKRVGINYKNKLDLAPGDYGVWFVVRDNLSGRTGSAIVQLKVPQ